MTENTTLETLMETGIFPNLIEFYRVYNLQIIIVSRKISEFEDEVHFSKHGFEAVLSGKGQAKRWLRTPTEVLEEIQKIDPSISEKEIVDCVLRPLGDAMDGKI